MQDEADSCLAFRGSCGFAGDEEETLGLGVAFQSLEMGTTNGILAGFDLDFA